MLPWSRTATCRYVECGLDGTFGAAEVAAALSQRPAPRPLAITGASNITGWMPPLAEIIAIAHDRGVPVAVDAAQLAPHRPLPATADFLAWSGHKMYAPFGTGVLVGPCRTFADGDPFLAGGGAVNLVELDEVLWTDPPEREEAGSPNVVGAVALHAAIDTLSAIGWPALIRRERHVARLLRQGLAAIDRRAMPGAVRASAGINTTDGDIARLLSAVARIAAGEPAPIHYRQDRRTGDFCPARDIPGLTGQPGTHRAPCSLG